MLCNCKLFFIVNGPFTVVNAYICCTHYIQCKLLHRLQFRDIDKLKVDVRDAYNVYKICSHTMYIFESHI